MEDLKAHCESLHEELSALKQAQRSDGLGVPFDHRIQFYSYEKGGRFYDQYSWFDPDKRERKRAKGGMRHRHVPRGANDGLAAKIREHNERCDKILNLRKVLERVEQQAFGQGTPRLPACFNKREWQFDHHASADPAKTGVPIEQFSIAIFRWMASKSGGLKRGPVIYRIRGKADQSAAMYATASAIVTQLEAVAGGHLQSIATLRQIAKSYAAVLRGGEPPLERIQVRRDAVAHGVEDAAMVTSLPVMVSSS